MLKINKNLNRKIYFIIGGIFVVGFLFSFNVARATTSVYFDLEKTVISAGDTFSVNLKISTPDKIINAIDGTILYNSSKLEIKEVDINSSLFTLWPKTPVFLNDKGTLSFVGGVPGGFQGDTASIMKIVFITKSEGETKIDFLDGFSVFLNDGKGTSINPWMRPFSVNILKSPVSVPVKNKLQYKIPLIWILILFVILVLIFWLWRLWIVKSRRKNI